MENDTSKPSWSVFGATARGASHLRSELPNQDAIAWTPPNGRGTPIVLSLSDGHGSAKYFRSDVGSKLAVKVATETMLKLLNQPASLSLSSIETIAHQRLPGSLVREWKREVEGHVEKNPFGNTELARLQEKEGPESRQIVESNPILAYGATVLSIMVSDTFALCLQIGDGVVLSVDSLGGTSRVFRKLNEEIGDDTESLCLPNAADLIQVCVLPLVDYPPAMILLTTDGYYKSFVSEADFLKVGSDYLDMVRHYGIGHLELARILEDNSRRGSGDDVTLGILKRDEPQDLYRLIENVRAEINPAAHLA